MPKLTCDMKHEKWNQYNDIKQKKLHQYNNPCSLFLSNYFNIGVLLELKFYKTLAQLKIQYLLIILLVYQNKLVPEYYFKFVPRKLIFLLQTTFISGNRTIYTA